jgi:ribosomal protein S18 acetylase RimI-like enzyme
MIEIRKLTINDINALMILLEQLWPDKRTNKNAAKVVIEKGLSNNYQVYICATDNEKLIGFCSLTVKNNLWLEANSGDIDELVVDCEYRNQGIGKLLMNKIEKIAQDYKCKRLYLESASHRTVAHEFYEKLGFEKHTYSSCYFAKEI